MQEFSLKFSRKEFTLNLPDDMQVLSKPRIKKSPGAFIDHFFYFREDDIPYIGFVVRLCYLDNFEALKRSDSKSDAISFLEMIIAQTKHMNDEYYPISSVPICDKYYPYITEVDEDFGHINVQTTKQMEKNILCLVSLTQSDDIPMDDVVDKAIKILQCVEFKPKK
jgi:hypothetical protein